MNPTLKHLLTILTVCGLTFFWNLGATELWDRDEPRNAGCAMEMLEANNWVVPIFNDELRPQKPVLLYWLTMGAYSVLGQNEFAARFWSALLGTGTCLLTYSIGRRLFDAAVGWLAGIMLATSLMFCVAARAATPDSVLIFFCTLAYWFYVEGVFRHDRVVDGAFPINARQWTPFYLALGLAVLSKGPIGYLIPMAVVGMFMLIERSSNEPAIGLAARFRRWVGCFHPFHFLKTLWSMRFLAGTLLTLVVAVPWYNEVDARTRGLFTELFFFKENFARAATAMENHSGGIWFYPLAILVGFFPWSVFGGPTTAFLWSRPASPSKQRSGTTFLLCWIVIQVITFSLFSTKLPSYVTPCYPALAILVAYGLVEFSRSKKPSNWLDTAAIVSLFFSGLMIAIGMWIGFAKYLPAIQWVSIFGLIPMCGAVVGYWLLAQSKRRQFVVATACCSVLFCWALFGVGAVAVSNQRNSEQVFERIAQHPGQVIGAWKCMEPSWVVYGQKPIYELAPWSDFDHLAPLDIQRRVSRIGSKQPWEFKQQPIVHDFLVKFPNALIVTTDEHVDSLRAELAVGDATTEDRYVVLEQADLFLKPGRKLVLLGPREQTKD